MEYRDPPSGLRKQNADGRETNRASSTPKDCLRCTGYSPVGDELSVEIVYPMSWNLSALACKLELRNPMSACYPHLVHSRAGMESFRDRRLAWI
jgi:hypothetical protein